MDEITLGKFRVGQDSPPFVIAEVSGNHNGLLDRALEIVDAAAQSGAQAVKLQTYTADSLTLNVRSGPFFISDPNSLWFGRSLYELYQSAATPLEWHAPIFERCRRLGLVAFSTPFDDAAVDLLESLDAPCYKVASFEIGHLPLIRRVAATGKPLIVSTGMATASEIEEAVRTARGAGCRDLILLKCTSTYPADPAYTNIRTIPHMRELFGCQVGLSDHTLGIGVAIAAVSLGATVIEKHVTLRRSDGGVDSAFSLEPAELSLLVHETRNAWAAQGKVLYGPTEPEQSSLVFRRSLYVAKGMVAGERFNAENLRIVRPGAGLPPRYYDVILGKRITRDAACGTAVTWDLVG